MYKTLDLIVGETNMEKTLIIPDTHCPYEDKAALHAVMEFSKEYKPDKIKLLGDWVDFYALSRFDKNPDRITSLQNELDVADYYFGMLRKYNPKADITMFEGNHELRLVKYLRKNPEMSSLRQFRSPDKMLQLDKHNIKYKSSETVHGVLFKHGNLVRKHGGYTAKGEFDDEGTSGVSGHTHRLGAHYKTDRSGQHAWYEMGHLCDEKLAEYMEGRVPNWQKGFGLMEYDENKKIWKIEQLPIINNSFIYNNKVYKWRADKKFENREALE